VALARLDWAQAALDALADGGLAAIAVEPLARRLGTTKGSFYWHFADRGELVREALDLWERRDTDEVIARVAAVDDPEAALVALLRLALGRPGCDAGVLAGAAHPDVGVVLERVTRKRLAFLERLHLALGLGPAGARHQARIAYALYLGLGELRRVDPDRDPSDREAEGDDFLDAATETLLAPVRAQGD
jgi:AcrR family transcriptional regulator